MRPPDAIDDALNAAFTRAEFIKRRMRWYSIHTEARLVVDRQRSNWGNYSYLNFGIQLHLLNEEKYPLASRCGVYGRLGQFSRTGEDELSKLLDLSEQIPEPDRTARLDGMLTMEFIPPLLECSTISGLRSMIARTLQNRVYIDRTVQELLEQS